MGRNKIADKSEVVNFRVDANQKKALMTHAKKLGLKKNLSDLVRDAVKEYVETLHREEAIDKLREERKNLVELYDLGKQSMNRGFDFRVLAQVVEASRWLLNNLGVHLAQPDGLPHPVPDDKVVTYGIAMFRELENQYSKTILDIYSRLLGYIAWERNWHKGANQFQRLLAEITDKMQPLEPGKISIPEIEKPDGNKQKE